MTNRSTEALIETLATGPAQVKPLRPPMARAALTLGLLGLIGGAAILLLPDTSPFALRAPGDEARGIAELAAMLATGVVAVVAAFHLSIPGRSRRWLAAPLPFFATWLLLSGLGCYRGLSAGARSGPGAEHSSANCLTFILGASLLLGAPLLWRLSRASPIDPLPVAALGGLGAAALSALLLQFFHPFAITFLDLAVHLAAIVIVVAVASILNRRALKPA